MSDVCKKRLKVPPRFVPYMETHRIYELFHAIATELVIKQPDDHIMFIKQLLMHLPQGKNRPRIILIAPPHIEKFHLATVIARTIGIVCVTHNDVLKAGKLGAANNDLPPPSPEVFARKARKFLHSEPQLSKGWILADFPTTRQDALALQKAGVLPTHSFQLLPSSLRDTKHLMDCTKKRSTTVAELDDGLNNYRRHLLGLRDAYRASLKEVEVRDRTMPELGSTMATLSMMLPHRGAPMLPRILLIGQRGSGRQTQAKLLCKRFNVVHVDFDALMAKTRLQDTPLAEKIRMIESSYVEVYPDILIKVLENRILYDDCLNFGWVLTGYPRSMAEFKLLDMTDTPPNRVVFLNVPHSVCVNRLAGRRYNMYTYSEHHLVTKPPKGKSVKQIKIHPMDHPRRLEATLPQYESKLDEMHEYAGLTAANVDGTLPIHTVFEMVSAVVLRPSPPFPPRLETAQDYVPYGTMIELGVQTSNMVAQTVEAEGEQTVETSDMVAESIEAECEQILNALIEVVVTQCEENLDRPILVETGDQPEGDQTLEPVVQTSSMVAESNQPEGDQTLEPVVQTSNMVAQSNQPEGDQTLEPVVQTSNMEAQSNQPEGDQTLEPVVQTSNMVAQSNQPGGDQTLEPVVQTNNMVAQSNQPEGDQTLEPVVQTSNMVAQSNQPEGDQTLEPVVQTSNMVAQSNQPEGDQTPNT